MQTLYKDDSMSTRPTNVLLPTSILTKISGYKFILKKKPISNKKKMVRKKLRSRENRTLKNRKLARNTLVKKKLLIYAIYPNYPHFICNYVVK